MLAVVAVMSVHPQFGIGAQFIVLDGKSILLSKNYKYNNLCFHSELMFCTMAV